MLNNILNKFKPSKQKKVEGDYIEEQAITLTPVYRKRQMTEDQRRAYATELLDTYAGFSTSYLAGYIDRSISNANIKREMLKITRSLPLLKFFVNAISRVYGTQPSRKFYLEGKEIIKKTKPQSKESGFDKTINKDKFIENDELFETLSNLYNDNVLTAIKQAERNTNLLDTCIYKVITDDLGKIKLLFLENDSVQVKSLRNDPSSAEQIAFIQDVVDFIDNRVATVPIVENWTCDYKHIPIDAVSKNQLDETDDINLAAKEYEKLFNTKKTDYGFAPFVVFRNSGSVNDFWDQKDNDIVSYIKSINMSLTELKYLEKFTSFGLKYTVNIKEPANGVMDPNGIINFAVANSSVPGIDTGKNFEIGEFKNSGSIEEVIKSIIFNMKMLFQIYHIPLDGLVTTNSVRSAENKELDNDALFAVINAERDIWNKNEQDLFKVMQAVHNRDNNYQIPRGIEMLVDYSENKSKEKTVDDWLIEIQNDISTALDWLAEINPDLDRDELMRMLQTNKDINDQQKKDPLDLNSFTQVDEEGNLIVPKEPNQPENENDSDN